jgi:hypothetical protein
MLKLQVSTARATGAVGVAGGEALGELAGVEAVLGHVVLVGAELAADAST